MDTTTITRPGHDLATAPTTTCPSAWPVVGQLVDALSRRDFAAMQALFADDVRFRGLVPKGAFELGGAEQVAGKFTAWFGGEDDFEVAEATVGQTGTRMYAHWRIRMTPAGRSDEARIAEQHVFTTGSERIETLDLLCSGFQADRR